MSGSFKFDKLLIEMLIKDQNRSNIVTSITIIWCRPYSNELFIEHFFISLHDQLMCSANEGNVIRMIKLLHNVTSEKISSSSWTQNPTVNVFDKKENYHQDLTTSSHTWHHREEFIVFYRLNESSL